MPGKRRGPRSAAKKRGKRWRPQPKRRVLLSAWGRGTRVRRQPKYISRVKAGAWGPLNRKELSQFHVTTKGTVTLKDFIDLKTKPGTIVFINTAPYPKRRGRLEGRGGILGILASNTKKGVSVIATHKATNAGGYVALGRPQVVAAPSGELIFRAFIRGRVVPRSRKPSFL